MSEPTIITLNQLSEIRECATKRFEVLANQLREIDGRFTFLPKSGYIRFSNIVNGMTIGSSGVVSWSSKWVQAYTHPKFAFDDGSILSFDERHDSKNQQTFEWVNDSLLIVDWKHQLDCYCDGIYSDFVLALKKEAEMMKYVKEQNIKKAAKFYELS